MANYFEINSNSPKQAGEDSRPAIAIALDVIGWLAIGISAFMALLMWLASSSEQLSLTWEDIIGGFIGGVLFLAAGAIVTGLRRIEIAIKSRET
jgi:hypothetical protein